MKNNIQAKGIELTEAISAYLEEKLSHVEKFLDQKDESLFANVELGKTTQHHKNGDFFRAEIKLNTAGRNFYASAEEADLYAAIDKIKDEIISEIKSRREKQTTLLRRGGRKIKAMLRGINPWRKF